METQTPADQAEPQQSVEDRISSIFGGADNDQPDVEPQAASDDAPADTDAPADEPATPAEETFEVEVDGERYALPKKLEKAVMQERDYTQKSQQIAEQRRLAEHQLAQSKLWAAEREFTQSVAAEHTQLGQLDAALKGYAALNWADMSTDDIVRYRMQMDNIKEQANSLRSSLDEKRNQFHQARAEQSRQLIQQAQETLKSAIPGWNESIAKEIAQHATQDGYTAEEIGSILDPRNVKTLWKAMQYDRLQAKAKPAVVQAKAIKTTPSNPMSDATKRDLNFRKVIAKANPKSGEYQAALSDRIASKFGG
jgi:hypothetical protein